MNCVYRGGFFFIELWFMNKNKFYKKRMGEICMLGKKKSHAFEKDVYLLGMDESGIYYWLEEPSWDCEWYWGFGYVETYTENMFPEESEDIESHSHFDSMFFNGPSHGYDNFKAFFEESVLTDSELWNFLELMKTAYTLKEAAEVFYRGGSNYSENSCREILKDKEAYNHINQVLLPALFEKMKAILTNE